MCQLFCFCFSSFRRRGSRLSFRLCFFCSSLDVFRRFSRLRSGFFSVRLHSRAVLNDRNRRLRLGLRLQVKGTVLIEAAFKMIEGSDIIGIAVERVLLLVADSLAVRADKDFFLRLPAERNLISLGELDSRQVRDAVLYDSLALELLAVDIERKP